MHFNENLGYTLLTLIGICLGSLLRDEHINGHKFDDAVVAMWPMLAILGFIASELPVYYFMIMVTVGWVSGIYVETFYIPATPVIPVAMAVSQ